MNTQTNQIIAHYNSSSVIETNFMDAGLESNVVLVQLSDGTSAIVKSPKPNRRPNYIFESDAYRKLSALGARVPTVLYADEQSLVMSVLAGGELDNHPELYSDKLLFQDIAGNLALCWQVEYDGFGPIDIDSYRNTKAILGKFPTWSAFLNETEQLFDPLAKSGQLEHQTVDNLSRYWSKYKNSFDIAKGRLIHGDFAMSAVFVESDKYSGLIDFGDAIIGDPLMDLAYFKFKEINKDYGTTTFSNLVKPYIELTKAEEISNFGTRINLYMIYWGLHRVLDCPEPELIPKFAAKLQVVADGLDLA